MLVQRGQPASGTSIAGSSISPSGVPVDERLTAEATLPLWTRTQQVRQTSTAIQTGDSVRYRFVDGRDPEAFVTIVPYDSNAKLGMLNAETAVAKALLGCEEGDEADVALPNARRRLRVLSIHKPRGS